MERVRHGLCWLVGVAVIMAVPPVIAQSNLDAGKSPAQLFSDTCGACHRSPRELKPTSTTFLRDHYSTGRREAAAMAAYLASIGSDPQAVRERRPPTLGAGQMPAPGDTAARPPHGGAEAAEPGRPVLAARPRRPSNSVEIGKLPAVVQPGGAGQDVTPSQTAAGPSAPRSSEQFEE